MAGEPLLEAKSARKCAALIVNFRVRAPMMLPFSRVQCAPWGRDVPEPEILESDRHMAATFSRNKAEGVATVLQLA